MSSIRRTSTLRQSLSTAAALGALCAGLAGCGTSIVGIEATAPVTVLVPPTPAGNYTGVSFGGRVMAGTTPLVGSSVQLYTAGTAGNGSASASLATATTDNTGAFTLSGGYVCPVATSQIYLVARGGRAGASGTGNNAIVLMTAAGRCNQVTLTTQLVVNEVTTVAAAYSLAQFLGTSANVGATATNTVGLANAAATAASLANNITGSSPGAAFAANGTSPAAQIDSIANLLNTCTASAGGSACGVLFAAVTPFGASPPTNTLDAAISLVRHPASNVAALYALSAANSAFSPAMTAAPTDWTLFILYSGGGMNSPSGVGVDGSGNIWVSSYFGSASLFSPVGVPVLPAGVVGNGLSNSYGLGVDAKNNAWIPNEPGPLASGNSVSVLNTAGQTVAGAGGFTAGGLNFPTSVTIDTDTTAWVVDYGNSHVTHLSSAGAPLSGTMGYTSPLFDFPVAAAVDGNHNLWVANQSGTSVTKVAPDGSAFTNYACCDGPSGLAIDQLGNVWAANYYGNSISQISSAGVVVSNGYTGGGIYHPQGVAIDGAGTVWVTNFRSFALTELAGAASGSPGTPISPAVGLGGDAALLEAYAIAIDASGNMWISNFGNSILTEFIGMAVPVRTPLLGLPVAP